MRGSLPFLLVRSDRASCASRKGRFTLEFIVALLIAGVVAFFVVQDASALRDEEIGAFGTSAVSPGLWGAGVFLMAIIFLPAYVFVRMSSKKQIARARREGLDSRPRSSAAPVAHVAQRSQPARVTAVDEIKRAYELLSQGAITEQEYEAIKARILR